MKQIIFLSVFQGLKSMAICRENLEKEIHHESIMKQLFFSTFQGLKSMVISLHLRVMMVLFVCGHQMEIELPFSMSQTICSGVLAFPEILSYLAILAVIYTFGRLKLPIRQHQCQAVSKSRNIMLCPHTKVILCVSNKMLEELSAEVEIKLFQSKISGPM